MTARITALVAALSLAIPASAVAAPPSSVEIAKASARERLRAGLRFYADAERTKDAALYERAYLEFAQAYAIYPEDVVLWNLAVSELDTKRFVEARRHLRLFDAHEKVSASAAHPKKEALTRYVAEAERQISRIEVDAPPGARVLVDGKEIGVLPLADPIEVTPGFHVVEIRSGEQALKRDVLPKAGEAVRVTLTPAMEPAPQPKAPPVATAASSTPQTTAPVRDHVEPNDPPARVIVPLAIGGAAVVAVAFGVGFELSRASAADRAATARAQIGSSSQGACSGATSGPCLDLRAATGERDGAATRSIVSFVVGGVLAVGAVATYLLWPRAERRATVSPIVSPTMGGLQFHTAF